MSSSPRPTFDLSAKRKALLEALLVEQGLKTSTAETGPRIPPRPPGPTPLSFAQRRLWFIDQFQPNSALYNIPVVLRLGTLDPRTLERTLAEIVRRHEVLRSRFVLVGGEPYQEVLASAPVPLEGYDFSGLPPAGHHAALQRAVQELTQRPFDLARGPHFRAGIVRLAPGGDVLVLVLHHIVADGWSTSLLLREIVAIYGAFAAGQPSPLPELPLQYADFAAWQRSTAGSEELARDLDYWRATLAGAPAVLELPTDRQRPPVQSFRGATRYLEIPAPVVEALKVCCQQTGATLFMGLLAAFATLLQRSSRQDDVPIGSPIANRLLPELEGLLGPFANTVVLRVDLSGQPTFRELLGRVRETTLGAYAHQALPFERLVEELHPERDLGRSPLFQVLFVLQNATGAPPAPSAEPAAAPQRPLEVDTGTAKFDLTLSLGETPYGGISGMLEYATDLFDAGTAALLVEHFQVLLAGAAADPGQPIWRLPLIAEHERRTVLVDWNRTRAPYDDEIRLHQLFEAQAARTPEAPAVELEGEVLTYRQLNARANQLARTLRSLGVGRESRVGICVERSFDMVTGMLGILKAGGVHTPLDPGYPKERLAYMLEDVGVAVVLAHSRLRDLLPETALPTVWLDREWEERCGRQAEDDLEPLTQAGDLAYVMFTSGSTGRPKGVAMEQRAMTNLFTWQAPRFQANAGVRTVQFTSYSFDVSVQEILSTLCTDGVLVLMPESLRRDFPGMVRFLAERRIQRLFLPFTALHQLAEAAHQIDVFPAHLLDIVSTGEQMHLTLPVVRFLARLGGCVLHNQYGPTETHFATAFPLRGDPFTWPTLPAVGRPIANTRIYVLDEHLQPVPVGVPGEVCIGGVMVAREYLNHPEMTAPKFLPDPFGPEPFPGEDRPRIYKTGDLARWRADGELEYLGRMDQQVKLRGFRIELGEIEAVLIQHQAVRDAVVVVREDVPGDKRLVAYVVPVEGEEPSLGDLRAHMKTKLPDYMLPAAIVLLPALPMTPNGKVDRRALRAPDWARPELAQEYQAPRDETERQVAAIWCEVLGMPRVGIHDGFFDLGGHSLLATQVVSRLRDTFSVELPLRRFFEFPTVAEVAAAVLAEQAD